MSNLKDFFLFCSGIHSSILKRSIIDTNKYVGIGTTIFFTGVFAAIAASFAIYSVFHSYFISIAFGILWGLMIFNLDRYIVMSMKKKGTVVKEFFAASPRIILALLIAFVISKPLELKIFQSEISAELITMEQEVFKTQEDQLKARFASSIEQIKGEIAQIQQQIDAKKSHRDALNALAIQEADGTGGSMQRNLGPIYQAKKRDADQAQVEYESLYAELNPILQTKRTKLSEIESQMAEEIDSLERTPLNGFAAQLDALGRLAQKSKPIWMASLFITLLFIAIETAPIFTKLIADRSPYDYKLDEHEHLYQTHHATATSRLQNAVNYDMIFDKETNKHKNQMAISAEKEIIKHLINQEVEKVMKEPLTWQSYIKKRNILGSH